MTVTESDIRFGRRFGFSTVHGESGYELSKMTPRKRLFALAWSHACPSVFEVEKKYGIDWAFRRYTECNGVNENLILKKAKQLNPMLYQKLMTSVPRIEGEIPDPEIDRTLVPPSFETEMSPLSTPPLYAIPRMILVFAKTNKEKVVSTREMLDREIVNAKDPIELALVIADSLVKMGADGDKIVYHLLSADILKEEGCKTMYREIVKRMYDEAPEVWHRYQEMRHVPKRMNGVITLGQLK